jgi:23S rRNA (cytidine2498-2'-O)-methyltransferase
MSARFVFAVTQAGAERALKNEIAREHPDLRFAFSRPGFVTFRAGRQIDIGREPELISVFARTWGYSIGKLGGDDAITLARDAWRLIGADVPGTIFPHVHVWHRERPLPGDEGFDGAAEELARTIGVLLVEQRPEAGASAAVNVEAAAGELVLDCVLVERHEWWLGWHRAASPETRWPGGVPPIALPERLVSRAYLKIVEALTWSELPVAAGDRCVEIGSAPGGSCVALLERGLLVTGIDPAEMDPALLAHPRFTHVRARAKEVKRSVFRECRWLVMDANVAPNYTLDALDGVLGHGGARPDGLVLTLKLTDLAVADRLSAIAGRLRGYGFKRVRMRQLAFNRQEICAVADRR